MAIEVTGANAASLGAMLSADILKDLASAGEQKIQQKNGPARTLLELNALYGEGVILHFPKPGTKAKDFKSNVLTDLGPWGDEGKQVSWYSVFYTGSSQGKMLAEQMRKHNEAKTTYESEAKWERDKAALMQRINTAVTRLKDSIKLNIQLVRVNQETEVTAAIDMEDGEVTRSNKCIFLRNDTMSKFKQWSIGQFMQIDVDEASDMKGGATWENVLKTTEREAKEPGAGFKVTKPVEFDVGVGVLMSYLTHVQENGNEKEYKSLLAHLNEAGSDYLLLSMDQLYTKLEHYLELPSLKERLTKLHEEGGIRAAQHAATVARHEQAFGKAS